nr:hypothetical protein [Thermohalobaculum xanthum]
MQLRRPGRQRGLGVHDRGQVVDVDLGEIGCILRGLAALGHDEGDRLADIAHDTIGKMRQNDRRGRGRQRKLVGKRRKPIRDVGMRPGEHHARRFAQRGNVDIRYNSVRYSASDHECMKLFRQIQIIHVGSVAGQQPRVLEPPYRLADAKFHDCPHVKFYGTVIAGTSASSHTLVVYALLRYEVHFGFQLRVFARKSALVE